MHITCVVASSAGSAGRRAGCSGEKRRGAGTGICDGYFDEQVAKAKLDGRRGVIPAGATQSVVADYECAGVTNENLVARAINADAANGPTNRDAAGNFRITGQVPGSSAVHTGSDIPLTASGRGTSLFRGVLDNTDVFFLAAQAAIGGADHKDGHRPRLCLQHRR